jgi:PST family polysaccharide transporter
LLIFSLIFVRLYGVYGGLVALVVMQSIGSLLAVLLISKVKDFHWRWLTPRFDFLIFKEFFPYWLMSLITLISTPLALMLIRTHIAASSSWDVVGLWEASWKISELYLLVITTALTTYYVPKLSQAMDRLAEHKTVVEVLTWGVIAAACLAIGVYYFRQFIVTLLFSDSFSSVNNLLCFQLLGSVIKIAAWVFAFHMLVTGKTKLFLISELVFGSSFYLLSRLFFDYFGLIGLSYAYFLNYILYLIFCFVYYRQQYSGGPTRESLLEKTKIRGGLLCTRLVL